MSSCAAAVLGACVVAGCGAGGGRLERASASLVSVVGASAPTAAPAAAPIEPIFSAAEFEAMESASRATIARDPACSPGSTKTVPLTSSGSPDQALTSILGALRRPRTAGGTPSWIEEVLPGAGPGGPIGSRPASGADAYVNAIRLARTALGVTFYILPAGEETGLRATPEWCDAEQSRVLGHILKTDPAARRQRVGQLQHEYLTWQRYEALNPEGFFLLTRNARAVGDDGGASTAELAQHGLLDGNAGRPGRALMSGVVPDGVASVTLRYRGARPLNAPVINNLFVAVPPRNAGGLASVVWQAADGTIVKIVPNALF